MTFFTWPRTTCSKNIKTDCVAPSGQEIMRRPRVENKTLLRAASRHKPPAHLINCAVNWIPRAQTQTQTSRERVTEPGAPPVAPRFSEALFIECLRNEDAACLQPAWPADKRQETGQEKHLGRFVFSSRATSWSSVSDVRDPGGSRLPLNGRILPLKSEFSINSHVCDSEMSPLCLWDQRFVSLKRRSSCIYCWSVYQLYSENGRKCLLCESIAYRFSACASKILSWGHCVPHETKVSQEPLKDQQENLKSSVLQNWILCALLSTCDIWLLLTVWTVPLDWWTLLRNSNNGPQQSKMR